MRCNAFKSVLIKSGLAASVLLLASGASFGQQQVNLTAAPATAFLPDGSTVPMWGYSCGTVVTGSVATCAALNPNAPLPTPTTLAGWSPVVITVPAGQSLTINLTNLLTFMPTGSTTANTVPTSLVIVGQVGGGLGVLAQRTTTPSPPHATEQNTWPIANTGTTYTPQPQGPRVQSMATEVAEGATVALTWNAPLPGTYLIESGTHPSIQGPMGLYGILVVTQGVASAGGTGLAYPGVTYNAEIPLLLSEIDPVQNNAVNTAVNTAGFSETRVWSGQPGQCGNPGAPVGVVNTCYPPAVNYTPLYYMINGVAFNKVNPGFSLFPTAPATGLTAGTGTVLVRLVNAGLRMHVPEIVGSQTTGVSGTGAPVTVDGFQLIAEDGNVLPGAAPPIVPAASAVARRVQTDVFMAPGKTYDVMVNVPAAGAPALAVFDRALGLSADAIGRDGGMLAYIGINGSGLPAAPTLGAAVALADTYNSLVPCTATPCLGLTVSDPSKGVIANDTNVYGVTLLTPPTGGTVTLNANGTFTYVQNAGTTIDSFTYCANGSVTGTACSSGLTATVTLGAAPLEASSGIMVNNSTFTAREATFLKIGPPGVLAFDKDSAGYPLTVANPGSVTLSGGGTLIMDSNGAFTASVPGPGTYTFSYQAKNSQGTLSASSATVTLFFPVGSGLQVTLVDGATKAPLPAVGTGTAAAQDYRWIIEEDRTFYNDPTKTTNTGPTGPITPVFGVNFHTSSMPFVAQGCTGPVSCETGQMIVTATGAHVPAVCDVGNGECRTGASAKTATFPSQVILDPSKRYYLSVLPGDASNAFNTGNTGTGCAPVTYGNAPNPSYTTASCGHGMGGVPIPALCSSFACTATYPPLSVIVEPNPFPQGKLSVLVFEDDFPLNGEQDAGGGIDVVAPNEPGLGGFNIVLMDLNQSTGDATGQDGFDMFNQPLSNTLAGTLDPVTGNDACPISKNPRISGNGTTDPTATGITGMIVTCPKFESDGVTLSPLVGQALINVMPGKFTVIATPGADRIARGEEWLQTNTLDGQKGHDSFIRIGEPSYFQEFGPAGYHVSIGFANPKIINGRLPGVCAGTDVNLGNVGPCTAALTGRVTGTRLSRVPDERLYSSGSRDTFYWTQCYVSFGDPDGEDFAFTKCAADGTFSLTGLPAGAWRITIFDQWNDQIVDGLATPANLVAGRTLNMGDIPVQQWQTNLYTRTFIDDNKDGISQSTEAGIPLIPVETRFRDGSMANLLSTDFDGVANFNETFPLFNWYTVETDPTRYKTTGIHVVYDAGGPADGSPSCGQTGYPTCGTSVIGKFRARTYEDNPLPANLSVPGAVYCSTADCTGFSIANGPTPSSTTNHSTGRIDPPWVTMEGWQGFTGQSNFIEFGKAPYVPGENGGIRGHVVYAQTRPFDDPTMLVQVPWDPLVAHVTINLYQEGFAADGITPTLTLVDQTQTSSWDDWAQGFRPNGIPNMNCPGQSTTDLFYFSLYNQPDYLDLYNSQHNGGTLHTLPYNSQYKCYDGLHNFNQIQPAPYDGAYAFPSVTGLDPSTGRQTGTNCTICIPNPDATDPYRNGQPMLPTGKYVVEVVLPPGYELVKEEDKNILIGDNFIAPVTQQFPGLSTYIFIMPDQASVAAQYNANNAQNMTQNLGAVPENQIVPGFTPEPVWPCVGALRIVPDYMSIFPQSLEVAPFQGASRHLCDRKEVTLPDQSAVTAKFYVYTSAHIASHFTGVITDDFTSEFDPFSPAFGEKFAPPNMPVSVKDWGGNEISRVYSDWWGYYDGLTYSTWEFNPPNITGVSPTMMVMCMNDAGPILDTNPASPTFGRQITDPLFNPAYSQFCYELPFMAGQTQYADTPVVPTSAFSAGYNHPDCAYPTLTPAISEVDGDGVGPWVSAAGHTLAIAYLGDQQVGNYGYAGPSATVAPFNDKTILRHYGFGATQGTVSIGGVPATLQSWTDTMITVKVPSGVPNCAIQQQAQYGGSTAQCGELIITAAGGQKSIDTVTVTIGGKPPTHVAASGTIQSAIDAAAPGDLIMVDPATHTELLLMWKPVRLQGVGAASSIIDANTHPAGKLLDPWRARVKCLFGNALNGQPYNPGAPIIFAPPPGSTFAPPPIKTNPYDPTGIQSCPGAGWNYFTASPNNPQVDRLPLEATVGWDTTLNGNLAEQLNEPTLMGAYEGAAITVLGKGVRYPTGVNVFGIGPDTTAGSFIAHEGQMPVPTVELMGSDCTTSATNPTNPFPSNFHCNPSSIDGLGITNSSQGGGGIFVHAWGHNLEIANNRIYNNTGTLSGGISVGQGESPDALLANNNGDPVGYNGGTLAGFDQQPWTCVPGAVIQTTATPYGYDQVANPPGTVPGQQLPYCYNLNVNIHNNAVTSNSSIGDELFSATNAGAGGVTVGTGADYYKFAYNWVCGNLGTGDGGGFAHIGFSYNADIEHNTVLFNQSTNPSIATNGGGILVMGAPPDGAPTNAAAGAECGSTTDADCTPGLSDGVGPDLVINANLIMGNGAESGSGGGLRLQNLNGTEVTRFPAQPNFWYDATVTNNIISNNVAGWDGGGVSLHDALRVKFINNTVVSNDSTASSGVLFDSLGAPLASAPGTNCHNAAGTASCPQVGGLVTTGNSPQLISGIGTLSITCPSGNFDSRNGGTATNGTCTHISYPFLRNDVIWQNRSFFVGITTPTPSPQYQQNVVALFNASGTAVASQTATGQCVAGSSYWDIGVRGDTGPSGGSGYKLNPMRSFLTSTTGYSTTNRSVNPAVVSQYCNGSRIPPEACAAGGACTYNVPPGISDAIVPNPIFSLAPTATVDEGNNWINMTWGPLSLTNPAVVGSNGQYGSGPPLGNYALQAGSPAINFIPINEDSNYPHTDFFGNPRPDPANPNFIDVGAVEFQSTATTAPPTLTSISPNTGARGTTVSVILSGTNLTGTSTVSVSGGGVTASGITNGNATTVSATFAISSTAGLGARNVTVTTTGATSNAVTFTVTGATVTSIAPTSGVRGTTVALTINGTNLTGATAVTMSGAGVTCTLAGPSTATTVNASCAIASAASLTARAVTVTTPIGNTPTTGAPTFTVLGPTTTSISPTSGVRGTIVALTISGTNLTGATAVTMSGTGVTCTVAGSTATTVNASCAITSAASLTARAVTVTTPIGNTPTTGAPTFTVTGATVGFAGPSPALTTATGNTNTKTGTITVSNTATGVNAGPLTLTAAPAIVKTSTAGGTFSITGGTCTSGAIVNPGGTCTITVQYAPGTSTTTATAHVTLSDSGAATATQNSPNFNAN
jgi:hypothetical protein